MELVKNWKGILLHSFSMHLTYWGLGILLAAVVSGLVFGRHLFDPDALLFFSIAMLVLTPPGRVVVQGLGDGTARPRIWKSVAISGAVVAIVMGFSTLAARAETQLAMSVPQAPSVAGQEITWEATAPLAVPLVARWEGLRTTAYLDTIASPPVWTICYGETEGVMPGEVRTEAECDAGLADGLQRYWRGWMEAVTEETAMTRLPPARSAAFASFSWNVGQGAARRSTATARLNRGNIVGACESITWFNRSGGMIVRGLENRRAEEVEFCMRDFVRHRAGYTPRLFAGFTAILDGSET